MQPPVLRSLRASLSTRAPTSTSELPRWARPDSKRRARRADGQVVGVRSDTQPSLERTRALNLLRLVADLDVQRHSFCRRSRHSSFCQCQYRSQFVPGPCDHCLWSTTNHWPTTSPSGVPPNRGRTSGATPDRCESAPPNRRASNFSAETSIADMTRSGRLRTAPLCTSLMAFLCSVAEALSQRPRLPLRGRDRSAFVGGESPGDKRRSRIGFSASTKTRPCCIALRAHQAFRVGSNRIVVEPRRRLSSK
jgi:hypothetical protein